MDTDNDLPIAVVGGGVPGLAALIRLFMQVAGRPRVGSAPLGAVWLRHEDMRPNAKSPYPLHGRSARELHPYETTAVFNEYGRQNFGGYVDMFSADDPSLRNALPAPTWRQICDYLQFQLDLAIVDAGSRIELLDANQTGIKDIQPSTPDGPLTILFTDDTTLRVHSVIRATTPSHMAGEPVDDPAFLVAMEVQVALGSSGLQFTLTYDRGGPEPFAFLLTVGTRRIAIRPVDLPDAALCSHVTSTLLPRLKQRGDTELWVVTQYSAGQSVPAQFRGEPVQFLALWQFIALLGTLKLLGSGSR